MRGRSLAGLALLALAGCHSPVTEVVVVIDTDLSTPREADTLQLQISSANANASPSFGGFTGQPLPKFPATIGLVPGPGALAPFSVTATLLLTRAQTHEQDIVVARQATNVQFVAGQTRALVLTLLRACACKGTNCPDPTVAPGCADLAAPTLTSFDPNDISGLDRTDGGVSTDAAADVMVHRDAARDQIVEAAEDTAADRTVEAGKDALQDAARDLVVDVEPADVGQETAPMKLALGHACSAAAQCQNALCVDGVCCENTCACGTCGVGGHCAPASAGTDPRGACGLYTCDGAGACVTSCPQEYGVCALPCAVGATCDGNGHCIATVSRLGYCVVGTCTCQQGLTCQPQDGGGPGVCL
ncbi:MAG TPA: hypothetical protein VH560_06690 [Polyangia bacterium]|nr:hypothetical protein [Polyangia bacterium]